MSYVVNFDGQIAQSEIYIKEQMIPESMIRKESRPRKVSGEEKKHNVEYLLKIIELDEMFNVSHTLFGYTFAVMGIPLNDRFIFELKKKFSIIQELYLTKMLERQAVTLIVVDAIETFRRNAGSIAERELIMLDTLGFSIEETMMNHNYIQEKWVNQAKADEENRENDQAFKKFLEEEAYLNKKKAEEVEAEGWECPVCICQIDKDDFGILECSHIFHPECIGQYLKSKIEDGQTDIKCPLEECGHILEMGDIHQYANPELKEKFQKFSFNKFVEKDGSTAWCPTAGCSAVFQFEEELDNYRCPACSKHYCLKCKCIYHKGMSCAQYKVNNTFSKGDEDFIKFVRGAKYKQCPKCNYWVERAEGCSTMTCKCGQEFCYVCGGTTCPHGSCANPPKAAEKPVMVPVNRPMPMLHRPHPKQIKGEDRKEQLNRKKFNMIKKKKG